MPNSPSKVTEQNKVEGSSSLLKIISKNFLSLPSIARDINVSNQNIAKIVKMKGLEPAKSADAFFLKSSELDKKLETESEKYAEKIKIEKVTTKEEDKQESLFPSLNIFKNIFSFKNILKVLGKVALPVTIAISLWEGITSAFDEWKNSGSIWEAFKEGISTITDFLSFGLFDKDSTKRFIEDFVNFFNESPFFVSIQNFVISVSNKIIGLFNNVSDFFESDLKIKPLQKKPVKEKVPDMELPVQQLISPEEMITPPPEKEVVEEPKKKKMIRGRGGLTVPPTTPVRRTATPAPVEKPEPAVATSPSKKDFEEGSSDKGKFSSPQSFVKALWPKAKEIGEKYGIPATTLLGQWALESGWGKSPSGDYNIFGIKSFGKPPHRLVQTKEMGLTEKAIEYYKSKGWFLEKRADTSIVLDLFKSYSSIDDAVQGKMDFLSSNKSYSAVFGSRTPEAFADALVKAGYATDKNYGQLLLSMDQSVKKYLPESELESTQQKITPTQESTTALMAVPKASVVPSEEKKKQGSADEGIKYPLSGGAKITSLFGERLHPITKKSKFHGGIDYAGVPENSPIQILADGKVKTAREASGYGLMMDIDIQGEIFRFAHLNKMFFKSGDEVPSGSTIGLLGNTGIGTGAHLHFEHRINSGFNSRKETWNPLATGAVKLIAIGDKPVEIKESPGLETTNNMTGSKLSVDSSQIASSQRQQQKSTTPAIINAPTTTNVTFVSNNQKVTQKENESLMLKNAVYNM